MVIFRNVMHIQYEPDKTYISSRIRVFFFFVVGKNASCIYADL